MNPIAYLLNVLKATDTIGIFLFTNDILFHVVHSPYFEEVMTKVGKIRFILSASLQDHVENLYTTGKKHSKINLLLKQMKVAQLSKWEYHQRRVGRY